MYLLDANVFIQSNRAHYGLDFVPAFWDWLDRSFAAGLLHSIQPIGAEIAAGGDDLSAWAASRPGFFVPMDAGCASSLTAVATWASAGHFTAAAVSGFLSVADYQLVAYAHAHQLTVVTMEKSEPARKSKVKVPDACIAHGVDWTTPFQMLRGESASFVLGA
ncbi:hypothetical protein CVS47_01413 [Microbacterium lemovicicum]|uniref:DUF4411 family protein n=1 Tax=Microbacterium lemovicicum TaxID=1072463 RepID=A0A3S9W9W0_9MICO|nr:DUF4411 family protein [Microbacterium lemovicicum]AZS36804.1 hypothetical protein CVS47_01413 [Microbacterium lemovicicum]